MLEKIKDTFNFKSKKEEDLYPPYSYEFYMGLDEKDYPKYLARVYKWIFNKDLDWNNLQTFNEKVQWLKLYDSTPIKTRLTDKVLVRDWVKEQIGEEYLKPVLQITDRYDNINFDALPNSFIMKANNGCKWHYIIKDKEAYLAHRELINHVRFKFGEWRNMNFMHFGKFELQYRDIKHQIIIEPLLVDDVNKHSTEYEVYCFDGEPKIYQKIRYDKPAVTSVYNQDFTNSDIKFNSGYILAHEPADDLLKQAVELSKKLSRGFKLVRVDWLLYNNRIYFNEMTFTPFSGFCFFEDENVNKYLGSLINIGN